MRATVQSLFRNFFSARGHKPPRASGFRSWWPKKCEKFLGKTLRASRADTRSPGTCEEFAERGDDRVRRAVGLACRCRRAGLPVSSSWPAGAGDVVPGPDEVAGRADLQVWRAGEGARRADEHVWRAGEGVQRADEHVWRADEGVSRADEDARRADELVWGSRRARLGGQTMSCSRQTKSSGGEDDIVWRADESVLDPTMSSALVDDLVWGVRRCRVPGRRARLAGQTMSCSRQT